MAADQRYCLECGLRGAETRLPFLEVLRSRPEAPAAPVGHTTVTTTAAPTAFAERLRVNAGLITGVGVLLLAMLVGVLIGSNVGGNEPVRAAAPTPPAQVIQVGGGAPTAATGPTGESAAVDVAPTKASKGKASKSKSSGAAAETNDPKAPVKATNNAVKQLDTLTGAAREKAVEKLGKNIPTGGKAPKKDSKPAAGGGSFEEIG